MQQSLRFTRNIRRPSFKRFREVQCHISCRLIPEALLISTKSLHSGLLSRIYAFKLFPGILFDMYFFQYNSMSDPAFKVKFEEIRKYISSDSQYYIIFLIVKPSITNAKFDCNFVNSWYAEFKKKFLDTLTTYSTHQNKQKSITIIGLQINLVSDIQKTLYFKQLMCTLLRGYHIEFVVKQNILVTILSFLVSVPRCLQKSTAYIPWFAWLRLFCFDQ